jgi:hypothetical protein
MVGFEQYRGKVISMFYVLFLLQCSMLCAPRACRVLIEILVKEMIALISANTNTAGFVPASFTSNSVFAAAAA